MIDKQSKPMSEDEYYSPEEVATKLKVSRMTIYRALKDGLLEGENVLNQWRVRPSAISNFLAVCKSRKRSKSKLK